MLGGAGLDARVVDALAASVGASVDGLDLDQFSRLVTLVDEAVERAGAGPVEEEEAEEAAGEELSEAEVRALHAQAFEQLRGPGGRVSLASLRAWDEVADLAADGVIADADLQRVWSSVGGGAQGLDLAQFGTCLRRPVFAVALLT